jgi:LysM repeat protein
MRHTARLVIRLCLVVFSIVGMDLFAFWPGAMQTAAGAGASSEVIDLVNQLRTANGLASYRVDGALMAAAQAHSEYMAESGDVSHTGAGGSSPAGRAAAAGYSGSGVIENIMSGVDVSAAQAVSWWQNDGTHLTTLLSTSAEDAGAGVASSGDTVYYTFLVGSRGSGSGGASAAVQPAQPASGAAAQAPAASTPPTPEVIISVEVATPGPDGAILHTVKEGQTMWDIASAYKMSLSDLYAINGLTDQSVIFPGERLLIRLPDKTLTPSTPTTGTPAEADASGTPASGTPASDSTQSTPTPRPATPTPETPTRAAVANTSSLATETPAVLSLQPSPSVSASARKGLDPLLITIGAVGVIGAVFVLVGIILKRSS